MDPNTQRILFICSPSKTLHTFGDVLRGKPLEPIVAVTLQDAEPILAETPLALVVCASQLIDGTYRDVLHILARAKRTVPVIVVALTSRDEECEEAMRLGAADCVPRPLTSGEVLTVVEKAFEVMSHGECTGSAGACLGDSRAANPVEPAAD